MEHFIDLKKVDAWRVLKAMQENLMPVFNKDTPIFLFEYKIDNFLTCLNLSEYFKGSYFEDDEAKRFEESSLKGIYFSLLNDVKFFDLELLLKEMPKILIMPYPVVKNILERLTEIIPQMMHLLRIQNAWHQFTDMDHELDMLKSFYAVIDK